MTTMADVASVAEAAGSAPVDSSAVLSTLLLCGLMGLLGQGVRAAVGLKTMTKSAADIPSQQSEFSAAYLVISLMIGFIAGVLAGLAVGLTNLIKINLSDLKVLLGIAAAGYAGADFIENTMSIVIPAGANTAKRDDAATAPPTDANIQALGNHVNNLMATLNAVPAKLSAGPPAAPPAPVAADIVPGLAAAFKSCAHLVNTDGRWDLVARLRPLHAEIRQT
jgi:hypothetical protein